MYVPCLVAVGIVRGVWMLWKSNRRNVLVWSWCCAWGRGPVLQVAHQGYLVKSPPIKDLGRTTIKVWMPTAVVEREATTLISFFGVTGMEKAVVRASV